MEIFNVILIQPLANGLILFYRLLGENMGLAIIGFSLFLRLCLEPLTRPYIKSMQKMREYAPELEKLKKRHKGDKAKLMAAQSDFYKQKGINSGAGCLPMILQLVVLFAFFNVFTRALGDTSKFNDLLYPFLKFPAGVTVNTHFLMWDLTKPDTFNIAGLPFPIPGIIVILAAISQMISAKMATPIIEAEKKIAKKTKGEMDDFQTAMQSSAIYTFPILTLLAGSRFPAGVAIYWLLFSVYQSVSQYRMSGWGGLTTWLRKFNLLQSTSSNGKRN